MFQLIIDNCYVAEGPSEKRICTKCVPEYSPSADKSKCIKNPKEWNGKNLTKCLVGEFTLSGSLSVFTCKACTDKLALENGECKPKVEVKNCSYGGTDKNKCYYCDVGYYRTQDHKCAKYEDIQGCQKVIRLGDQTNGPKVCSKCDIDNYWYAVNINFVSYEKDGETIFYMNQTCDLAPVLASLPNVTTNEKGNDQKKGIGLVLAVLGCFVTVLWI